MKRARKKSSSARDLQRYVFARAKPAMPLGAGATTRRDVKELVFSDGDAHQRRTDAYEAQPTGAHQPPDGCPTNA